MSQTQPDSVRTLLSWGRRELLEAGVDTAELDAQLLLAEALRSDRTSVLASLSELVGPEQRHAYRELVRRRASREPLAYITGRREFWGRTFLVGPGVLVPRPETELLVERALELSEGRAGAAADVGTGSGCIGITFALQRPRYEVYATDTSPAALDLARLNARGLGAAERVAFLLGDLLAPLPVPVDLVLANLPYVPSAEVDELEPEVRAWEPRGALDGGTDGLDLVRALLQQLPGRVTPDATCLLEIDPRQYAALVGEIASSFPRGTVRALRDLSGRIRVAEVRPFTRS